MTSNARTPITWRDPIWARAPVAVMTVAVLIGLVVLTVIYPGQGYTWAIGAVFVFNLLGEVRRSCTMDGERLLARGRFATREVPLKDLRQVARGLGSIWVQTHHPLDRRGGDVLSLRMIPVTPGSLTGKPSGDRAIALIRERALAAGADLDPPLDKVTRAPSRKPLIFSV